MFSLLVHFYQLFSIRYALELELHELLVLSLLTLIGELMLSDFHAPIEVRSMAHSLVDVGAVCFERT